jgi:hypothetical protein
MSPLCYTARTSERLVRPSEQLRAELRSLIIPGWWDVMS